jgi:peptidyl-prolyl cis-trans isomerase-like protein 2
LDTLNAVEKVEVDNKDRPIEDIIVQSAQVFVDPFQEADEQLAAERAAEAERLAQEANRSKTMKTDRNNIRVYRSGIGKYVKLEQEK